MECVRPAALLMLRPCEKREQAPRTPCASRCLPPAPFFAVCEQFRGLRCKENAAVTGWNNLARNARFQRIALRGGREPECFCAGFTAFEAAHGKNLCIAPN